MADQEQAAGNSTQAEQAHTAPQAGTTAAHAQEQSQAGGSQQEQSQTVQYDKYKKVQSEAENLRKRLKAYEDKEAEMLPAHERLQRDYDNVKAERDALYTQVRQAEFISATSKAGAIYPDAVARMIAADTEDVDAAVKQLRKDYPGMFRTQGADAGAGNNNGRAHTNSFDDMLRSAAGRGA